MSDKIITITASEEGYEPFVNIMLRPASNNYEQSFVVVEFIETLIRDTIGNSLDDTRQVNETSEGRYSAEVARLEVMMDSFNSNALGSEIRERVRVAIKGESNLRIILWTAGQWHLNVDMWMNTNAEREELYLDLFNVDAPEMIRSDPPQIRTEGSMEMKIEPKFPEIDIVLAGRDGNAMLIIGRVSSAMREGGIAQPDIDAYVNDAMSGDYDHLLQVTMQTVKVS